MNSKLIGRWGEAAAAEFLRKKRYKIVGMGYNTRFGEVDIIAENRKYIVFVEVKTRRDSSFAEAREFVTAEKRRRVMAAAELYLAENRTDKQPRFDVIEVYAHLGTQTERPQINHIENAFSEE